MNLMVPFPVSKFGLLMQRQALGVKLIPTTEIVSIAKEAGYDSLFIELEHSSFSLSQASQLCAAGIMSGITPFVRVPHQCGNGFVQRVLDGGAMGVIFPHISTVGRS
jgi:2-keto-3-deoxy-L-rhamnonate aldolase RhmA